MSQHLCGDCRSMMRNSHHNHLSLEGMICLTCGLSFNHYLSIIVPEPTIPEPTIPEPTVSEPTIPDPTIPEPTITEPTIPEPTILEEPILEPSIIESTISEPAVSEPSFKIERMEEPNVFEPIIKPEEDYMKQLVIEDIVVDETQPINISEPIPELEAIILPDL